MLEPQVRNTHALEADLARLQAANQRLNVLCAYATDLLSMSNADTVLWHTCREVVAHMGFVDCVIYLWDPARQCLIQRAAHGHKNPSQNLIINPLQLRLGEGVVGRAAATRAAVRVDDLRQEPGYVFDVQAAASELAIPVLHRGQLLGVIDSEHPDPHFYTDAHQQLLTAVAAMLAAKLAKTQMIEQLERSVQQLQHAELLQKAMFRIAALSFEEGDLRDIYAKIHHCVSELLYAKSFFIAIYNPEKPCIEFPYFVDEADTVNVHGTATDDTEMAGLSARVIFSNKALMLNRKEMQVLFEQGDCQAIGPMPESWLGVPIEAGGELRAAVVVQSYDPRVMYSERDRELLVFVSQNICNLLKRKLDEQKLQHLALHDPLTGLANRALFLDRVTHALQKQGRRNAGFCAILYMDVDRFKAVNDRFGHSTGDALLSAFAQILKAQIREVDTVARLGGDEFAILLEGLHSEEPVLALAERILAALQKPVDLGEKPLVLATSIGVTFLRDPAMTAFEAIRRADIAMYQAKADGRGTCRIYDAASDAAQSEAQALDDDLREALAKNQFTLWYQPIVALATQRAVGFEALIRWPHPEKGWIPPDVFIAHAEKSTLIEAIDRHILQTALAQMRHWRQQLRCSPHVSVNISGRHFSSDAFIDFVIDAVRDDPATAHALVIEITERAVVDDIQRAAHNIRRLQEHGIRVSLDDFGTGYSSLSYLHRLPLDILKIDRSFVSGMQGRARDNPIVASIVALANTLELKVVAEGVETSGELAILHELGCGFGQGWLFAKPLPADQAIRFCRP